MNEAETRAELIDPALRLAGWGKVDGSRKRSQSDIADYVLVYRGQKLAVIEAKKVSLSDTEGLGQAKRTQLNYKLVMPIQLMVSAFIV